MFFWIYQFLKQKRPNINGYIFRLLFSNKKLIIKRGFKCDTWPSVTITHKAKIFIEQNVYFRRNVELRAHNNSMIKFDGNNRVDRGVRILSANDAKIHIESGVRIGLYTVFNGGDSITVGKNSLLSGFIYLQTSMHKYKDDGPIKDQGYIHGPVKLGEDNWLGAHVVVFPNVKLEKGCIVGSNAVVNISAKENAVLAGIPAKIIKNR